MKVVIVRVTSLLTKRHWFESSYVHNVDLAQLVEQQKRKNTLIVFPLKGGVDQSYFGANLRVSGSSPLVYTKRDGDR